MAKIIYKDGCEGQNTLESIEGIEIDLLNGQKALIYPKYSEEVMLQEENIKNYGLAPSPKMAALKETESECLTDALHDCGSPAAEFVHKFYSDKYGRFHLPTLLAASEIQNQKFDIDVLAIGIEGTDLLCNFDSDVWSCSRYGKGRGWIAVGSSGFAAGGGLCDSYLAVPVLLYQQRRGARPALKSKSMDTKQSQLFGDKFKHQAVIEETRDSPFSDETFKSIKDRVCLNNQPKSIRKETACDFCREAWCWFEKKHVNKGFCDKLKLFNTGKRIANDRALALYDQELRRFKRLLNSVSKDGTGGELISVGGRLAAFKKALEDDK